MEYSKMEDVITRLKNGGLVIVSDDEDRENEGDLVGLGATITPESVNFIITHARGLLCAPISKAIADQLDLKPMVENNTEINKTSFYTPLDGNYESTGVTTGVSAYDRTATINKLADKDAKPSDFVHPGHMFPLVADDGGVLARNGHTEAAIDLAKLADEPEVGAICEIIMPDGSMARKDYLELMAVKYNLPIITIKQLQEHMRKI
ncbi:3,4-dihydroxy-2-butanone-4-phosphate synthase [Fructilactobacillus lindneri]|uniref:3,4-dihydroxy-2-butanone 4-phosphate synthase n=2 Tax=Fructilactobacillus lindneri TaxID=53444 RepID=A0A0R2JLY2_9LACO|nr:3,4-dihydroxy-2-butanone-4-phosphate synthase [Fructilactobacillus lindneri]ANZ57595.1 hypothetical protein AYR60_01810 [Fructilactobacillus lindneri]ANZ58864.1 hypothetical protein AYR59_01810 [Fructilactobacillus lindneri]KRN78211.1 34-dihydroxy-2-butanone 4-phosphate synthase gtp cyclohydrolase ii [Fructilactobacillus lindneri DSM 20690 = JCM 11027]POG97746.1 3,4-dihydroxy-2-butanone-4-phosphate synthase [Fructilactobacillus lindneri]POH00029.1 3,4-dihydroxy-2-butanone-4-phosphate syntha